jgi:hypothetical protein
VQVKVEEPLQDEFNITELRDEIFAVFNATGDFNPDAVKLAIALWSSVLNTVDCSDAPDCSSINRKDCSAVSNTCGLCLNYDDFFGSEEWSNDSCLPVKAETNDPTLPTCSNVASPLVQDSCDDLYVCDLVDDVRLCTQPAKTCPSSTNASVCSGNGVCVFQNEASGDVYTANRVCRNGDVSCIAACACLSAEDGSPFAGIACDITTLELEAIQSQRTQMLTAFADQIANSDASETSVQGWNSQVLAITGSDPTVLGADLTDSIADILASLVISSARVGLTEDTALLSVLDQCIESNIFTTLNHRRWRHMEDEADAVGEKKRSRLLHAKEYSFGQKASSRRLRAGNDALGERVSRSAVKAQNTLLSYASMVTTNGMMAGQIPVTITGRTFALSASVSVQGVASSVSVPLTAVEKASGVVKDAYDFPPSSTGAFSVGVVSLKSCAYGATGGALFKSFPTTLSLSQSPCAAGESQSQYYQQNCTFNVTLQNFASTSLLGDASSTEPEYFNATCDIGIVKRLNHVCSDSGAIVNITCDGIISGFIRQRCPSRSSYSVCNSIDSSGMVIESGCTEIRQSPTNITCRCPLPVISVKAVDLNTSTIPLKNDSGYTATFVSMVSAVSKDFASTISTANDLEDLKGSTAVFSTLGVVVALAVLGLLVAGFVDRVEESRRLATGRKRIDANSSAKELLALKSSVTLSGKSRIQPVDASVDTEAGRVVTQSESDFKESVSSAVGFWGGRNGKGSDSKVTQFNEALVVLDSALPAVLGSTPDRSLLRKALGQVIVHHRWITAFTTYRAEYSRAARLLALLTDVSTVLLLDCLVFNVQNPDDGECETLSSGLQCTGPRSNQNAAESKCFWDGEECHYRQSDAGFEIILFALAFVIVIGVPMQKASEYIIENWLALPTATASDWLVDSVEKYLPSPSPSSRHLRSSSLHSFLSPEPYTSAKFNPKDSIISTRRRHSSFDSLRFLVSKSARSEAEDEAKIQSFMEEEEDSEMARAEAVSQDSEFVRGVKAEVARQSFSGYKSSTKKDADRFQTAQDSFIRGNSDLQALRVEITLYRHHLEKMGEGCAAELSAFEAIWGE